MDSKRLYDKAWLALAEEQLTPAERARLERVLARQRGPRRTRGDALLLATLGLVPRTVRRLP